MPWPGDFDQDEYDLFVEELGIWHDTFSDSIARDLLEKGWFDESVSPDERHDAREAFLEFMADDYFNWPDFWDEWRDWYESQ